MKMKMKKMIVALALVTSVTTATTSQASVHYFFRNVVGDSKFTSTAFATIFGFPIGFFGTMLAMDTTLSTIAYALFGTPFIVLIPIAAVAAGVGMFLDDDSSSIHQYKQVSLEDAHKAGVSEVALSEYNDNVDTLNMINEHIVNKIISGEISSKKKAVTLYNELAQEFGLDLSVTKTAVQLVSAKK